ncbi:MAG: serine hydrolase [Actinobacteria bacterium]|nr:serine hydrolase [Actinomycetota bacterium]
MKSEKLAKFITKTIKRYQADKKIPGIALGLIKDGKLINVFGVGEISLKTKKVPDANSVFRIASMTKSFTATAILLLRDRGLLRLDDPITKYLPWTKNLGLPENSSEILLRDLLTMGAGFPTDDPWGDRQEGMSYEDFENLVSKGISFARQPKTGFEYSNLGYALLGRVVSVASGVDYFDFVKKEILNELDMKVTTFDEREPKKANKVDGYAKYDKGLTLQAITHPGSFSAMGGISSSINDLTFWVAHFQSAWKVKTKSVLKISSVREMQEPQRHISTVMLKDANLKKSKTVTTSYGFGLFIDDDSLLGRFVSHSGGYPGFGSHMRWHPQSGYGVIALGNLTYAPMNELATEVMNKIVIEVNALPENIELDIWKSTQNAVETVVGLLNQWDEKVADKNFAMNVDMDKPRQDRVKEFKKVKAKLGKFKVKDVKSDSPATAKAELKGSKNSIFVEVQMSPEKDNKIQKITFMKK